MLSKVWFLLARSPSLVLTPYVALLADRISRQNPPAAIARFFPFAFVASGILLAALNLYLWRGKGWQFSLPRWTWPVTALPLLGSSMLFFVQSQGRVASGAIAQTSGSAIALFALGAFLPASIWLWQIWRARSRSPEKQFAKYLLDTPEVRFQEFALAVQQHLQRWQKSFLHRSILREYRQRQPAAPLEPLQLDCEIAFLLPVESEGDASESECVAEGENDGDPLPDEASGLLDAFDRCAGNLLLWGMPGAGKSTMLVDFAVALSHRLDSLPTAPLPVVCDLSYWRETEPFLMEFAIARLRETYGLPSRSLRQWFAEGRLLLLFDGLEELPRDRQERFVEALQRLQQDCPQQRWILCGGAEIYEGCLQALQIDVAIFLKPAGGDRVRAYLQQLDRQDLWEEIDRDEGLAAFATSPLLLNVALQVPLEAVVADRDALFDAYVERRLGLKLSRQAYPPERVPPSPQQTSIWLSWIAGYLDRATRSGFAIEDMSPAWLETPGERFLYRFGNGMLWGFAWAIVCGSIGVTFGSIGTWIVAGAIGGFVLGVAATTFEPIQPLPWSWRQARIWFLFGLALGITLGLLPGLLSIERFGENFGLFFGANFGLLFGLADGLLFGAIGGIWGDRLSPHLYPNQRMRQGGRNAATFVLLAWLCCVAFYLFPRLLAGESVNWGGIWFRGFGLSVLCGLLLGGFACLQHVILRWVCSLAGLLPLNCARFLDYGEKLGFLQRVGGKYRFVHDLFQEYFAGLTDRV